MKKDADTNRPDRIQKAEEKSSRKSFNYLVRMARRKGALVEVKIINR